MSVAPLHDPWDHDPSSNGEQAANCDPLAPPSSVEVLQAAALEAIGPTEVRAIIGKLVELGSAGDVQAALGLLSGLLDVSSSPVDGPSGGAPGAPPRHRERGPD